MKNKRVDMDNKPWYKKIPTWIGIISGIFTILGISIFGGKSLLNNKKEDTIKEERYYRGTITKTGWESKFIGLRYTNPEGMSMLTEEELDSLIELDRENLSNNFSQYELGFITLTSVFEMMSMSDDQSIIVGVCVERLIDETDIFQFIKSFETQINRHPLYNYTLINDDKTVRIGNDDYIMVSYMIDFNNVFRYQDSYFRIVGDRVIMILLNFNDERARDNILDAFSAIE